ncbi:dienelactone hydrolase [Cyathus striatus]|nr:dienelactone hydrolase [Cyathus striatus]
MITRLRTLFHHPRTTRVPMSTSAPLIHNTNKACCTIPPVQSDYTPKGTFKSYASFNKVYRTGPSECADKAMSAYFPQTQQGADIIASTLNTPVYMPDFFEPDPPFPYSKYPPKTEEDKQAIQEFFGGTANPSKTVKKLVAFGKFLKSQGVKNVGVYGFCWGGKVVISSSGKDTPFSSAAIVHPAMLSGEDAKELVIPFALYVSKDEPVDEYNAIVDILSKNAYASKNDHKSYDNMFHGWAAARGDLKDTENKKEYEDVYERLVNFFKNTL